MKNKQKEWHTATKLFKNKKRKKIVFLKFNSNTDMKTYVEFHSDFKAVEQSSEQTIHKYVTCPQ